jgi:hypothetical protein
MHMLHEHSPNLEVPSVLHIRHVRVASFMISYRVQQNTSDGTLFRGTSHTGPLGISDNDMLLYCYPLCF